MEIPAFDHKELEIVGEYKTAFGGTIPLFNTPVSVKENSKALAKRQPYWQPLGFTYDFVLFAPRINPDNIARAFVYDGTFVPGVDNRSGGKDMFGIEWVFVPTAGGSMVQPGKPLITDAEEFERKVVWPDLESWDWEASAKANEGYLSSDRFIMAWLLNGWYERLISFMDFEGAAIALIDEEQKDYVKGFFDNLTDFYIRLFDKFLTYFPQIDGFYIHDDWGAQKDTFFSPEVAEEMIVPYMRRVTDYLHSKGKYCELHSCGQLARQVPNIIKAGWDAWTPQVILDADDLYEKYGDKLILGFGPELPDQDSSDEEQREAAGKYARRFCKAGRPTVLSSFGALKPAFFEELYKQSRINYSGK